MRRIAAVFLTLVLVIAACGDDDDAGTTEAPAAPAPAPAPTDAPAAPAPTDAAAPDPTDAPAASPEDTARALRIAAAELLAGEWSGEWNNTTFGATGPIDVTVTVDSNAAVLLANYDIGGSVFGQGDPKPGDFEIDLIFGPPYEGGTGLLGRYTIDIGYDGSFTLTAPVVPADGIASMTLTGTLGPAGFSATYAIKFSHVGSAEGTIEATRDS